jgi:hypothetical protein
MGGWTITIHASPLFTLTKHEGPLWAVGFVFVGEGRWRRYSCRCRILAISHGEKVLCCGTSNTI